MKFSNYVKKIELTIFDYDEKKISFDQLQKNLEKIKIEAIYDEDINYTKNKLIILIDHMVKSITRNENINLKDVIRIPCDGSVSNTITSKNDPTVTTTIHSSPTNTDVSV